MLLDVVSSDQLSVPPSSFCQQDLPNPACVQLAGRYSEE